MAAVVVAAMIGVSAPGHAQTATPGDLAGAQPAPPKAGSSDIVCRSEDTIGTRLGAHRVCHTRLEWAQIKRNYQDNVDHAQTLINTGHTQ